MPSAKIALFAALLALLAACGGDPVPPAPQASPADLARQAPAPIDISPRVAAIYRDQYLAPLEEEENTSGVFVISPDGNRFEMRTCDHDDCELGDDEIAMRALDRCNLGFARKDPAQRCLVFDRNGTVGQPYKFWTDAAFDMPVPAPPALSISDPRQLLNPTADERYLVMTPEGQLRISLRPDGSAYFWDTGDYFHQGTWALVQGGICVNSVDERSIMACGTLYGTDPKHPVGVTLDLFPGKFLPVIRLTTTRG